MKSFFKKLAFVMALAMVVSTAAPAAASAAVEGWENFYIALENKSGAVPADFTMTEGEEVDFRMAGKAPSNWRDYSRQWRLVNPSTNEKVEKTEGWVKSTGLVKTKVAGLYELQYVVDGEVVGSVPIKCVAKEEVETPETPETPVVPEPSETPDTPDTPVAPFEEFTVDQKSLTSLEVVFANPASPYGVDDVVLYLTYPKEGSEEPIKIKWPLKSASKNTETGVITLVPYVLKDGDSYRVVVGDETNYFDHTVNVGTVDTIKLEGKHTTEVLKDIEVSATLYANDGKIDVTSTANQYEISYDVKLVGAEDPEAFSEKAVAGTNLKYSVKLLKVGVTVEVTATVKNNKGVVVATTKNTHAITSVEEEPWTFDAEVKDWCFINTADPDIQKDDYLVNWNNKTVPADKSYNGEYQIVLKIQNGDETYVTSKYAVHESHNKVEGKDPEEFIFIDEENKTDEISKSKRKIRFYSTDANTMLVTEKGGKVGVYKEAEVAFYVALVDQSNGDDFKTYYIYAETAKIGPGSKFDDFVTADGKYAFTVVDGAIKVENEDPVVTFNALDQYDEPWGETVYYTASYMKGNDKVTFFEDSKNNTITLSASMFDDAATEVVTIVAKNENKEVVATKQLTVSIVTPNRENGQIVTDKATKTYYNDEELAVVDDTEVKLKDLKVETKTITVYKTSNGAKVDTFKNKEYILVDGTTFKESDIKNLENGDRYMMLKTEGGQIVPLYYNDKNEIYYNLNSAADAVAGVTGQEFIFADDGKYTLTYGTVWMNKENGYSNPSLVKTATINVKYDFKTPSITGVKDDNYTLTGDCFVKGSTTPDPELTAIYKLTYKDLDSKFLTKDYIDVKAVVLDGAIIIQSVTVRVYEGNYYREITMKPTQVISLKK